MKKEYTLSQQFAIVSLDGQSCIHCSTAKSAAVRGIAMAEVLEEILQQEDGLSVGKIKRKLEAGLEKVKGMRRKELEEAEKRAAEPLLADGALETVPDLLGCDMNYYTAGIEMKAYRADREDYLSIVEGLRGEILEDGPVTLECVCLLWLIRECGCIHDICSVREQERIQERMVDLCAEGNLEEKNREQKTEGQDILTGALCADILWKQEFHKSAELMMKSFLKGKRQLFKNPYLQGINLLFPFLERRQAIFIDFVLLGTDTAQRRQAVELFLSEKGHYVEEVKSGTETLLRIDNMYYRIWPKTIAVNRVPVQGAGLLPVYQ